MTSGSRVSEIVVPLLAEHHLDLYDLEVGGGLVRVAVSGAADLDVIASVTRAISRALDEADPIEGAYTLEVTTPGLERTLRTPSHFAGAVGETVKLKLRPDAGDDRRVSGTVMSADDTSVTVEAEDGSARALRYEEIERARTTFAWGPAAKQERKAKR